MLHRSFKPAKCKTSLKLATSRLKLFKNKKDVQLKQMKKELAQLLESGQERTARIRVEHVVREEKMIAAFDLLEVYCELIAARLPIIESQKNCPIDMKEAITSVVFASPRCADIPELQDICKHFTAKYGKEFISAAIELRPQCGVGRMIVEKLSASAPDGPTKIKILTAIAEEHNIKWDPKSFGETELKPHEDLLNGPNKFEMVSRMQREHSTVQAPPSYVQAPPAPEQKHNGPGNFEYNATPSTRSGNFASEDARGSQADMASRHHPGVRPSGTGSERHSYSGGENSYPSDRKHWNMDFKDATAAAQAAAEAAERASMAARAAAELSSRGQYSTESPKSNVRSSRDEGPPKNNHDAELSSRGQYSTESPKSNVRSSRDEGPPKNNHDNPEEDNDKVMKDFLKGARYTRKSSFEEESMRAGSSAGVLGNNVDKESRESDVNLVSSGRGGMQTDSFNYFAEESIRKQNSSVSSHSHTQEDLYSQNSSEETVKAETGTGFSGMNTNRQSIESGAEFFSSGQGGAESGSFNYFAQESIREKNGNFSSHLHSSSHGDDYDVSPFTQRKYEIGGGHDPFDHENEHRETEQTSSYSRTAAVFDEPVSDDDHENILDTPNYTAPAFDSYPASPAKESARHEPFKSDTWSPRHNMSGAFEKFPSVSRASVRAHSPPKFDGSSIKSAKSDEFSALTFDKSEGPSSESDDEVDNSRLDRKTQHSSLSEKGNIFLRMPDHSQRESHGLTGSKGDPVSKRKEDLCDSSDDEWVQVNKQGTEFGGQSQKKFGFDEKPYRQSSGNEVEDSSNTFSSESLNNSKDDELLRRSSLESGNKLKLGMLTGGLRHKGYMPPPFPKSPSSGASSFKNAAEDSVTSIDNSPAFPSVKNSVKSGVSAEVTTKSSSRTSMADSDSDSDESEEELPQRNLSSKRETYKPKASREVDSKLSLRAPVPFFDSEGNDSKEDTPKQTVNTAGRVGSGFSRRTKATPSSGTSSHSKATFGSEASEPNVNAGKTPSRSSHYRESPTNLRSETANSVNWRSSPDSRAERQSTSRPKAESNDPRSSYPSETPSNPSYQTDLSGNSGRSPPEPRAARQPLTKPMQESNISTRRENTKSAFEPPSVRQGNVQSSSNQATSKPRPESSFSTGEENPKSSTVEQRSSPLRTVTSAGPESPGSSPSGESSQKKVSHIHPKLPDYDTLAAQFQSLRSNR